MLELALQPFHRSCGLALAALSLLAPLGRAQQVECISIGLGGQPANGYVMNPYMGSSDGRFVAFISSATNLVAPPPAVGSPVYLRDRATQVTTVESYLPDGTLSMAWNAAVSDDGRYVWFQVMVPPPSGSNYTGTRVYRRDRVTQTTTRLLYGFAESLDFTNCSASGELVSAASLTPGMATSFYLGFGSVSSATTTAAYGSSSDWLKPGPITKDGRYLVYGFDGPDLNGSPIKELVRHDRLTGQRLVLSNQGLANPTSITADGRYLAVTHAYGRELKVYDAQLQTSVMVLQTPWSSGGYFWSAALSEDARHVAFLTQLSLDPSDVDTTFDVYVLDRVSNSISLVSKGPGSVVPNYLSAGAPQFISGDQELLFAAADGMIPGDTNGFVDLFAFRSCPTSYRDADGDGFGDLAVQSQACQVPAGYVLTPGDCDDTSASRHPGALELCNGIDDDCDGEVDEAGESYCESAADPLGCEPQLTATGCPSLSAGSGYVLRVDNVRGQRSGLFLYGSSPTETVFVIGNPSRICVAAPRQRMSPLFTGGTAGSCNGALSEDFLAWSLAHPGALLAPFAPGQSLHFQAWLREPAYPGSALLSAGWKTTLAP